MNFMLTRHFHSKPASTSTWKDRALLIHDDNMEKMCDHHHQELEQCFGNAIAVRLNHKQVLPSYILIDQVNHHTVS